jgi:DNA-binding response OmpR family regulator
MRLLLVEDSPRLIELLMECVSVAGWSIDSVSSLSDAEVVVKSGDYNLLVCDLGLPDGDGIELIKSVRLAGIEIPILVISARNSIEDRILGLDAGADDYLAKPFNHNEFLARCRAMLRRAPNSIPPTVTAGNMSYEFATCSLRCGSLEVSLSPRERSFIELLMRDIGRVVAKRKLETALSALDANVSANAIELIASRLRKRLSGLDTSISIETVRGIGYMMRIIE